jgi:phage tail sheath gpL-like
MGIAASAVARGVGIDPQFKDFRTASVLYLPQRIAVIGQGNTDENANYAVEAFPSTSALAVAQRFGFGSPLHHAARELFPPSGGGVPPIPVVFLPLKDDGAGVAATGSITPSGAAGIIATYYVRIAGILSAPFVTAVGDNVAAIVDKMVAAIDAVLEMPMDPADGTTDVDLTCKWKGLSGNDLTVEVLDESGRTPSLDITFAVSQPASGAADPDVAPALALFGSDWVTLAVNALGPGNTTALGKISDKGEERWAPTVNRPFVCLTGNPEPAVGTATTVTAARLTDRVNAQVVAPGSPHLPVQIAAAHAREIAKLANDNPPTDYALRPLRNLLPGTDAQQWDYAERDQAVKAGSSTIEVKDGQIVISDVVTMYHPTGEVPPAYRYVVDIMKLFQAIYNFDLEFRSQEWAGAPLIPDGQPTSNPRARTPKAAKAAACAILDGLALEAIISDPATAKKNTTATIDSQNPKRINIVSPIQLSGNTGIVDVTLNFGFFFGTPAVVG